MSVRRIDLLFLIVRIERLACQSEVAELMSDAETNGTNLADKQQIRRCKLLRVQIAFLLVLKIRKKEVLQRV